jgi:hypothetical protein
MFSQLQCPGQAQYSIFSSEKPEINFSRDSEEKIGKRRKNKQILLDTVTCCHKEGKCIIAAAGNALAVR